jgi:disulfide bond formation protein DsbB
MCWFQRICMYPLSILTLFLAWHGDNRAARYLLVFPVIGGGVSIYHILIENHVVATPSACQIGGAGCAVKWIDYFGYMTIPTLALTAFALLIGFLGLAVADQDESPAILPADA